MVKKAAAEDFLGRFREIVSDPLNLMIQRVPHAGTVRDGWVCLHNGNFARIEGPGAYYGDFSHILVINRGVLEPLGEFVFQELIKRMPNAPLMLELGEFWGFYSMWLKRARPSARVVLVGAKHKQMEAAQAAFARNGLEGEFVAALLRRDAFSVDAFLEDHGSELVDVVQIDAKGAELEMLDGAAGLLAAHRVRHLLIATHSEPLHAAVAERLAGVGYRIEVSSDFSADTTAHKGLILASRPEEQPLFDGFDPMGRSRIELASPDYKLDYLNGVAAARPATLEAKAAGASEAQIAKRRPLSPGEAARRFGGLQIYVPFQGKTVFETLGQLPLDVREGPPPPDM